MTPVDIVAKAIFQLSIDPTLQNDVYHLNNPTLTSWDNVFNYFIQHNADIEFISFHEWQEKHLNTIDQSIDPTLRWDGIRPPLG